MKILKRVIIGAVALFALLTVVSSLVVTKENEYSLIRRFGKVDRVITDAGLTFKVPFIEQVDSLPDKILIYDLDASDVITKDKKTMITDSYVLWQISDPLKFAQTMNFSMEEAGVRIGTSVYNAIKNVISNMDQNEVIDSRDGELTDMVMTNIGNNMDQYGIQLLTVETKRLDLPEDNKTSVYERMISERQKIAKTYQADGEAQAKMIRNTTDKEVAISISNARAEAANLEAEAEAEYMRIMAEAYSDPQKAEFYTFVRSLEAAKSSLVNGGNTLILPSDSPIAEIFMNK